MFVGLVNYSCSDCKVAVFVKPIEKDGATLLTSPSPLLLPC